MTLLHDERAAARVIPAKDHHAPRLATTLAAAFYDDPVFRWFSPDDRRRRAMLPGFFDVFVEAFMRHGETYTADHVAGAALWAAPGIDPLNAGPAFGERLEQIVGVDAPRLFEIVEMLEAQTPPERHYHLQFLAVHPERQGAGLGGALMAPILARCDRDAVPAYLEATSDRNRALYERHGFRAQGDIPLPDGPALWRMWRDPVS
jgi:ribosomal protein S18 acetylase RimI-like enzyme